MSEQTQRPEEENQATESANEIPQFNIEATIDREPAFADFLAKFEDSEELIEQGDSERLERRYKLFKSKKETISGIASMLSKEVSADLGLSLRDRDVAASIEKTFDELLSQGPEGLERAEQIVVQYTEYCRLQSDITRGEQALRQLGGEERADQIVDQKAEMEKKLKKKEAGLDKGFLFFAPSAKEKAKRQVVIDELRKKIDAAGSIEALRVAKADIASGLETFKRTIIEDVPTIGQGIVEMVRQRVATELEIRPDDETTATTALEKQQKFLDRIRTIRDSSDARFTLVSQMLGQEQVKIDNIFGIERQIRDKQHEIDLNRESLEAWQRYLDGKREDRSRKEDDKKSLEASLATHREELSQIDDQENVCIQKENKLIADATDLKKFIEVLELFQSNNAEQAVSLYERLSKEPGEYSLLRDIRLGANKDELVLHGGAVLTKNDVGNVIERSKQNLESVLVGQRENTEAHTKLLEKREQLNKVIGEESGQIDLLNGEIEIINQDIDARAELPRKIGEEIAKSERELEDLKIVRQETISREKPINIDDIETRLNRQIEDAVKREIEKAVIATVKLNTPTSLEKALFKIINRSKVGSLDTDQAKEMLGDALRALLKGNKVEKSKRILLTIIIKKHFS
ncbi:MAG: hypothetical protein PHV78_03030 [Patescibacteria group bacterium]|nr:hypothetical protein [Patescibacteria group bacterium]MDD5121641.1 hypothetical protein [Patescibacteria group bacterium]MDD5396195.1 hypothetical protein [Patescibacteria group bacterium]